MRVRSAIGICLRCMVRMLTLEEELSSIMLMMITRRMGFGDDEIEL